MSVSSFLSNQGTQTPIIVDTIGGSVMAVQKIDISPLGADGTIWGGGVTGTINNGSIVVTAGTVTVLPNIPGGTLALVSAVGTIGTIGLATVTGNVGVSSGTVTQLPNIPGGSIAVTTGTIPTLGTMGTLGLVNTVTSVTGLASGTINLGTFVANGGTIAQLTNGSIVVTAGTFRQDARTTQNIVTFGTSYGTSGSGASTIIGSTAVGAGTSIWLNDFSIMNNNANVTCILGFGTAQQGTNVLFRGSLGTAGAIGIEKIYPRAVNAGMTNQDLVFSLTGAGTVDLSVSYLISV